jgi:hypothetical protein
MNSAVKGYGNKGNMFYKLMTGAINDSTHLTFGSNGGTTISNFMYPDNPINSGINPQNGLPYWSMCNPISVSGDIRNIISTHIPNFASKDILELNFASITHWGDVYPCPSFNGIAAAHDIVDTFFKNLNCGKINAATGSTINNDNKSVQLFPNPASRIIALVGLQNQSNIQITDIVGRNILKMKSSTTENINQIDISELPVGIYILKIQNHEGIATNLKFVKN